MIETQAPMLLIEGMGKCSGRIYLGVRRWCRRMRRWAGRFCKVMPRRLCLAILNRWVSWWGRPPFCSSMGACKGGCMGSLGPSSSHPSWRLRSLETCTSTSTRLSVAGAMVILCMSKMKPKTSAFCLSLSLSPSFFSLVIYISASSCVALDHIYRALHQYCSLHIPFSSRSFYSDICLLLGNSTTYNIYPHNVFLE